MENLVSIQQKSIEVKEYQGQRVVTFKDIDKVHQRPEGTAKRNFTGNRKYFICGVDYFKICSDEIRSNKIMSVSPKLHQDVVFLTESGYLMLVKSFTDDLAWQVQRELVNTYFRAKQLQPQQLELEDKPYQYQPKKYKGIPVVTTADLEHFTCSKANNIAYQVRRQRKFFDFGVDYWLLQGKELAAFKAENMHWPSSASSLLIFTQSGVGKLSQVIYGIPQELSWLEIKPEDKVKELACMQEQKDIDNYSETVKSFLVKSFLEIQGTEVQLMQLMSDIIENPEDRSKERAIYFSSLSLMLGLFKQTVKCFSEFA